MLNKINYAAQFFQIKNCQNNDGNAGVYTINFWALTKTSHQF